MAQTVNARSGKISTKAITQLRKALEARCRKLHTYEVALDFFGLSGIEIDGRQKPKQIVDEMDAILRNVREGVRKSGVIPAE